jgi:hypothetical protein
MTNVCVLNNTSLDFQDGSSNTRAKMECNTGSEFLFTGASSALCELKGVAQPTTDQSVATKLYVDDLINGLKWKQSVKCISTANIVIASSGTATIDGYTLTSGDRVLLAGQTTATENGIYISDGSALNRTDDMPTGSDVNNATVFVEQGTTYGDTSWTQTADGVAGTVAQTWVQTSSSLSGLAGQALVQNGTALDVNVDNSTIEIAADALRVKDDGITTAKILDANVTNAKLEHDDTTLLLKRGFIVNSTVADATGVNMTMTLGLTKTLELNPDDVTVGFNASHEFGVKALGIDNNKIADNTIQNVKLVNDSVAIQPGDGLGNAPAPFDVVLGGSALTIQVDNTVVRTSGVQTIGGVKTFTDPPVFSTTTQYTNLTVAPATTTDQVYQLNGDLYFEGINLTANTISTGVQDRLTYYDTANSMTNSNVVISNATTGTLNKLSFNELSLTGGVGSTSTATGDLVISGGAGVGEKLYVADTVTCLSLTTTSDKRLKTKIRPMDKTDLKVEDITPCQFEWLKDNRPAYGVVAQEMLKVCPQVVNKDAQGYLSVDYLQLIMVLINEVKALKKK